MSGFWVGVAQGLGLVSHEVKLEPLSAVLHFDSAPYLIQGAGVIQGGAVSGMLERAVLAAASAGLPAGRRATVVDMDTAYLRAAPQGPYRASAQIDRRGATLAFARAELRAADAGASLIATASMTVHIDQAPALEGQMIEGPLKSPTPTAALSRDWASNSANPDLDLLNSLTADFEGDRPMQVNPHAVWFNARLHTYHRAERLMRIGFEVPTAMREPDQTVTAAAIAMMLDFPVGVCGLTVLPEGHAPVTARLDLVMTANSVRERFVASGRVIGQRGAVLFTEGEIRDDDGTVCGRAVSTILGVPLRKGR